MQLFTLFLQESGQLLFGEKGLTRLKCLQKMLRLRQQHLISQVAYLYPVKTLIGATQELELDAFPSGSRSGAGVLHFRETYTFVSVGFLTRFMFSTEN